MGTPLARHCQALFVRRELCRKSGMLESASAIAAAPHSAARAALRRLSKAPPGKVQQTDAMVTARAMTTEETTRRRPHCDPRRRAKQRQRQGNDGITNGLSNRTNLATWRKHKLQRRRARWHPKSAMQQAWTIDDLGGRPAMKENGIDLT
jgi:hypothetical protein